MNTRLRLPVARVPRPAAQTPPGGWPRSSTSPAVRTAHTGPRWARLFGSSATGCASATSFPSACAWVRGGDRTRGISRCGRCTGSLSPALSGCCGVRWWGSASRPARVPCS